MTNGALLHDLVLAQAGRTPNATAVWQGDEGLTYRELVSAAAALAHRLRELGAGPEVRIGICHRRTPELLVCVLGVLMSGGAYVPLDPSHPRRRLAGIIEDAGITTVVTDETGADLLAGLPVHVETATRPGDGEPVIAAGASEPPTGVAPPGAAAYVLYTSGSTGRPKGVVVSHASAVTFVTMAGEVFGLDAGCRSIGFAALGFDVSVLDVFAPLARGGSVMLIPEEDRVDPVRLQRFLERHRVTWGTIPPALLPLLEPERLPWLRDLLTAGEPAGPEQVARWATGGRRFHNWYGPTETTVCVVGTELAGAWDRPLPIGYALPGCQAYILDDQLRPCPPGTPGELCIGGPQLARGYLDRPGLSAERFVPDPYGGPGARMYRTGDLVVLEEDGRIGFIGRLDRQVKVQGQRVEIGEIEAVLRAHPDVRQAVADVSPGPAGLKELTAYLAPENAPGIDEVRAHCLESMPAYMVPTRVVRLAVLPLTVAGKIDMAALRAHRAATPATGTSPAGENARGVLASETERGVAAAWAEAFGSEEPGPEDDFLACGGHSLVAMRLTALLRAGLGREIEVSDVLAGRTVAGIARRVELAPPVRDEPLADASAALSAVQRRMWFVERLAPGTPVHNIAMAQRLSGPLNVAALRAALAAVAERHEVLRWRVPQSDGVPAVAVSPPGPVPLPVEDVTEPEVAERLEAEARLAFDLAEGPLWRARLLRIAGDEHVLAITAHHLVFDGWSQQVLYDDLGRAYRDAALPPLRTSFGGYVAYLDGRNKEADLEWWRDHLEGAPSVLDLPRDHPRPAVQTFEGAGATAEADAAVSAGVRALATRLGGTPYSVMLAAFAQVLRRLTGQHDLIVGAPVADRRDPAFHPLTGCLVQVLPVRLRVEDGETFEAHVTRCQETLSGALAHLDVHLERLVDRLGPGRDLSRNPLIQVLFNMYDFTEPRLDLPGVTAVPLPPGLPGALFDLTLYVGERDGRYVLQAVYNPRLFRGERIEELLAGYLRILGDLVTAPERPVRRASLRPGQPLPGQDGRTRLPDGTGPLPAWDGPGVVERVLAQAGLDQVTLAGTGGDRVAVAGEEGELTYAELARLAAATGDAVSAAVRPGDTVAILAARTYELPALMLGVLGAGARWAVLDSALPPARLAAQARSAGARALIACPGVPVPPELAWLPELAWPPRPAGGTGEASFPVAFEGRGYLAFTSGTTGEPKPVRAAERPLARFLAWYAAEFELTADDRFALLAGLAHDPLLRDAWTPLTLGATLHVPGQDRVRDPARLAAWLRERAVTVAHLTPQLATLIAAAGVELPDLRLVLFGGDRLTYADVARFAAVAPKARLVNTYGTTETPQAQAVYEITGPVPQTGDPVPVGHGVDGAELLVLDADGAPAAVGELGEVVIRSRRLAEAYLDDELTRLRFTREPDGETARYRTGDLGRHDPEGRVVPAGRADGQVKIRGYRVELGEIEAALTAHPGVRAAAAKVAEQPGGRVLHAYAVPESAAVQAGELRRHLAAGLPDYAVPAELVLLPALPLTPNGKVDRAALPAPPPRAAPGHGQEPTTPTERLVAGIWREVLGLPRVSADANFFEIGGHSLATAQVQARLAASLGREVPIVDLFRFPTVRTLAAHLDGERRTAGSERAARRVAARQARPSTRPHRARRESKE
ncbi:non-ribosomal peptide synthetase [Nonomuraea jiangxiensis]|uniref:Amino acid adenylation domain-containing protein n=1 Tax=Nonomuraea jiangxiensis TaxID=633440 RepID=A0A1G8EIR5_9ACTN|nr:non-ribosomal peptide synthetase [Nonomuraea jiangxiensis]SDH69825.1 amino acid adenylation domain-containing protein [Nonomuraea jiangxiensis]